MTVTHERLTECLYYEAATGHLRWRVGGARNRKDAVAGSIENGYRRLSIDNKAYMAHRLVWFYLNGEMPREIDHINGDRSDNRIENLREATRAQNNANMKRPAHNRSGFKGVAWHPNGYFTAQIMVDRHKHHLGCFVRPEDAHAAYCAAAIKYRGEFARAA